MIQFHLMILNLIEMIVAHWLEVNAVECANDSTGW